MKAPDEEDSFMKMPTAALLPFLPSFAAVSVLISLPLGTATSAIAALDKANADQSNGVAVAGSPTNAPDALGTESKREYRCPKVAVDAVQIDGLLTEPAWQKAEVLTGFQTAGPHPKPASKSTRVQLLWTDSCLLVGFVCESDGVRPQGTQRDEPLWEGEAAEIFLCPGGSTAPYYEVDTNPNGAIYDTCVKNWRYEVMSQHWEEWKNSFNTDVRAAVKLQRDAAGEVAGWSAEFAIPFKDMVATNGLPKPGSAWLFDVFRVYKPKQGDVEFSAWEPTCLDFHRPYRFARLLFVE